MLLLPIGDDIPRRKIPFVTFALVAVNLALYVLMVFGPEGWLESAYADWTLDTKDITVVTLFSSMFLHAGPLHLVGNMVFLWVAGDDMEDRGGPVIYLILYLMAGLVAHAIHIISIPEDWAHAKTLGASGAVSGLLGAYVILYPAARIRVFYWLIVIAGVVRLPAWIFLGGWFALQVVYGTAIFDPANDQVAGVAYWAHIGGFVYGVGAIMLLRILGLLRKPPEKPADNDRDV